MRTAKIVLAVLFCATLARAETLEGLSRRIDDIAQGRDSGNQIQDLRVQDDATIGDDLTVSGDAAVTGAATVTGKTTANGELEANADVDINLGSATEEITIDQTNAAGTADVPMCLIRDARTGTTANATNEATIVITAEGTYGLAVTKGGVDFAGTLNVAGDTSVKSVYGAGTFIEQDSSVGAFRIGRPASSGWQINTAGGGTIFQIQKDYARTGMVDALLIQTNTTIITMPVSTNGFNLSGSLWNSNGYVCVWTP